jgi:hypothetical protein
MELTMQRLERLLALMLLASALALFAPLASAQVKAPACWPTLGGQGYVEGTQAAPLAGDWAAWWCLGPQGDWRLVRVVAKAGYAPLQATSAATDQASRWSARWSANVREHCATTVDVVLIDLCAAAMRAARATLPLPPWVVRPNGSYTTRPIYDLVNGVRSRTASGTVNILDASGRPTACNHAVRVVEGSSTYAQIPNVEPVRVALCSRS